MDTNEMLIDHKNQTKEYLRKKRSDAGVDRTAYKAILPVKYRSYVSRANSKGLSFNLSIDEFNAILSLPCAYCGDSSGITIDRMDSKDGYVQGNVQPCCLSCNIMKHSSSHQKFIDKCRKIVRYLNDKSE